MNAEPIDPHWLRQLLDACGLREGSTLDVLRVIAEARQYERDYDPLLERLADVLCAPGESMAEMPQLAAELKAERDALRAKLKRATEALKEELEFHATANYCGGGKPSDEDCEWCVDVRALLRTDEAPSNPPASPDSPRAEYKELKHNKCETHVGARVACGQCHDSNKAQLAAQQKRIEALEAVAKAAGLRVIALHNDTCGQVLGAYPCNCGHTQLATAYTKLRALDAAGAGGGK